MRAFIPLLLCLPLAATAGERAQIREAVEKAAAEQPVRYTERCIGGKLQASTRFSGGPLGIDGVQSQPDDQGRCAPGRAEALETPVDLTRP